MPDDVLAAVLETIVPGTTDGWPSACAAGIVGVVARDAAAQPARQRAFADVIAVLPIAFAKGNRAEREAALALIERAQPEAVAIVVSSAFLAYYTSPTVLAVMEAMTGYSAEQPQPRGHVLAPFDPSALAVQRRRAPFWRQAADT